MLQAFSPIPSFGRLILSKRQAERACHGIHSNRLRLECPLNCRISVGYALLRWRLKTSIEAALREQGVSDAVLMGTMELQSLGTHMLNTLQVLNTPKIRESGLTVWVLSCAGRAPKAQGRERCCAAGYGGALLCGDHGHPAPAAAHRLLHLHALL